MTVKSEYAITEPETFELDNAEKTLVTAYPINDSKEVHKSLIEFMKEIFNYEVEKGDTYPHDTTVSAEEFEDTWFHYFAAIMVLGERKSLLEERDWRTEFCGTFYVKPNYIGRCSHNCNGGFLVNPGIRGKRIGSNLGKVYLRWAPKLGYTYSVFNLVFETNVASVKIWDNLGFERIGRIKNGAVLKPYDKKVDAIMFGKDLV